MKLIVLVIGPESTATRAFTKALSNHDKILGTKNPSEHFDILDPVWFELEHSNLAEAIDKFPKNLEEKLIVTRRSVPHGIRPGENAKYMSFPNIELFFKLCNSLGYNIFILVTSRSPLPNLFSTVKNRKSVEGNFKKAFNQYQFSYRKIFQLINIYNIPYFLISVEAFIVDKSKLIMSLHKYFELDYKNIEVETKTKLNDQYYDKYLNS